MRLTDSTQVRSICQGKLLAVFEPGKPALLIDVAKHSDNVFECGWLVEDFHEGERYVTECGAPAVSFENGFACVAGHDHRNDCEYYTEEEAHGTVAAGYALAPNARII